MLLFMLVFVNLGFEGLLSLPPSAALGMEIQQQLSELLGTMGKSANHGAEVIRDLHLGHPAVNGNIVYVIDVVVSTIGAWKSLQ